MRLDFGEKSLIVYQALASDVRLKILRLLSETPLNIRNLAKQLDISSAITTQHVQKLLDAGLIRCETKPARHGRQKICYFEIDYLAIDIPKAKAPLRTFHEFSLPVGHYTSIHAEPTCGLATKVHRIGHFDDIRSFLHPERVDADILWFGKGYVEYTMPLYLTPGKKLDEILISCEIGSEYPMSRNDWPSEISFYINQVRIGECISPGDFSDHRGTYTPEWWDDNLNQYGILKMISIRQDGSYIDGIRASDISLSSLNLSDRQFTFRMAVEDDARHIGGLTVFGKGFGDYPQDIKVIYYESNPE